MRNDERRREEDVIAARAIHAALSGIGEDLFRESGLADAFGDVFFFGERLASRLVFDELDAPVGRVTSLDAPAIYSPPLEKRQLPDPARVIAKVLDIC